MNSLCVELKKLTKLYHEKIEIPTIKNPQIALIISVALKLLSLFATLFSQGLGLLIFLYSNVYDYAIVSNFETVLKNLTNFLKNTFMTPELRGYEEGRIARDQLQRGFERGVGYFSGLFNVKP